MDEIIQQIEAAIPADWGWLVRRHDVGYFANICPHDVNMRDNRQLYINPVYADTPFAALSGSFAQWRETNVRST